ncbi:MAG: biosynthetic arginine decarboxylase [Planctomycetes bacterium]|nr:biosynthetic arginine decarboxylase [Planctomycetota bacterium]
MANLADHRWTVADSLDLYKVAAWGAGYFTLSPAGHLIVTPRGPDGPHIDLKTLIDDLLKRGLDTPILLRFSDILSSRIRDLHTSFNRAIEEYSYPGRYQVVFPIKVNQQRHVVEELVDFGRPYHIGLEAGSKPELLVALALLDDPEAFIICNGYKDEEYVETAILAQKLGRTPVIVVDRLKELDLIVAVASRLGVRPHIGMRARLSTRGAGKWMDSAGDRSKFGLTTSELVEIVERLRTLEMLDCLELLHFHIGSQISNIRAIKDALREASRIFVELQAMGAGLKTLDVGGGLAVDYDGSSTNFHSSANYSLQEYANDVVYAIGDACRDRGTPAPVVLSESGRALVAHHAALVFDVLDVNRLVTDAPLPPASPDEHEVISNLREVVTHLSRKNIQESYHDAQQLREECISLFTLGYLDLGERDKTERLYRACLARIRNFVRDLDYVPDEFEGLEQRLSDTYYCNFSVFQSAPDHWAVKQLFPVMPIHRLDEEPTRRGTLADLTCDSDGKVDQFIDLRDVKPVLELHELQPGESYFLGMFLVGAYQEILGDLHNLFGDTNAIHVELDDDGDYRIKHVVEGDSVTEVLGYVQYDAARLIARLRSQAEQALRQQRISLEESARLLRAYRHGLQGYTYLEKGSSGVWD